MRLSGRDRQVLALVRDGLVNKEIAARLGVSESTVKNTISNRLFRHYRATTRTELARLADPDGMTAFEARTVGRELEGVPVIRIPLPFRDVSRRGPL